MIFKNVFEEFRKAILKAQLIMVTGKVQVEGEVVHVIAQGCYDFSKMLRELTPSKKQIPQIQSLDFADETFTPSTVNPRSEPKEKTMRAFSTSQGIFGDSAISFSIGRAILLRHPFRLKMDFIAKNT